MGSIFDCLLALLLASNLGAQELLPGHRQPPVSSFQPYKVLNLNILYCTPEGAEGYSGYVQRLTRLLERLRVLSPDIMVFQEVANCKFLDSFKYLNVAKIIASQTGTSYHFWKSEGIPDVWDEGLAFFWNPKKVQFDAIECENLKTSKQSGFFQIKKSLCGGNIHLPNGQIVRIYNTHLDVEQKYSLPQTQEILRILAKEVPTGAPLVLTGDFNNPAQSAAIAKIEDFGLDRLAQDDVDFLFTRDLGPQVRGGMVDFKSAGISDHNGLWLEIFPRN